MKTGRKLFGLLFLVVGLLTIFPASAMAANKGYTISSGNTTVYSNTALTKKYGTIYGTDEVTIHSYKTNQYAKVTYPTSRGSKTGYIRFDAVMTASSGYAYTARSKTTTYRRPSGSTYGYISAGDRVIVLGQRGNYTQVYYPVSGGHKFAFIKNSDLNNKIIGDNYVTIPNGTYSFTSAVKNGMVMDVYKARNANGTNIILYQNNNDPNQQFTVTALGSGWYKILCIANGKSIDVAGGSTQSGANVQLYEYNGSYAQQWKFYDAGNGYYYIKNRLGNWLDVNGASSANETNIQVWEKNTSSAQKWRLTEKTNPQPVITYGTYSGVDYTKLTSNRYRLAALDKAKKMVTIKWTAPCDFVTWAAKSGAYNTAVATDGTSNTKFVQGKTYTGIPYSMIDHSYDDSAWSNLLKNGISTSSMKKTYSNYSRPGTAKGIDCSYFTYMAFKSSGSPYGISYETTSSMLKSRYYTQIDKSSMKPGDILLKNGHVMMFVGRTSSGRYAVFEADADDSKCSYNTYTLNGLSSYKAYKYKGFYD